MYNIDTLSIIASVASALDRSESDAQNLLDTLRQRYEEEDLLESREWDMMDHMLLQLCRLKGYSMTTEWKIKE